MAERLEFSHVVDGPFFRGLDAKSNPALMSKIKAVGIDLSRPLEPAYPAELVAKCIERMQRNFRTDNNYVETRFQQFGPEHVELWFNEVNGLPLSPVTELPTTLC